MSKVLREVITTDLMYAPCDGIYSLVGPMMLENGWSVWPQNKSPRKPSIVDGSMFHPTTLYERLPNEEEVKVFNRDAPGANIACTMGTSWGKIFSVDIDCMDPVVSNRVQEIADDVFGTTSLRRIGMAPKIALFYRYDNGGCPHTRVIRLKDRPDCMIEIQGFGKAMTMHGIHHITGHYYKWPVLSPLTSTPQDAIEVSAVDVERFIKLVEVEFPFQASSVTSLSSAYSGIDYGSLDFNGIVIPDVDYTTKLADGREAFMLSLAWNVVRRNSELLKTADAAGGLDTEKARVIAAVISVFEQKAELSGSWNDKSTKIEAAAKVNRAIGKLLSGEMKPWVEKKVKVTNQETSEPSFDNNKPLIKIEAGEMSSVVSQGEVALVEANLGIYQRSGRLVRMGFDKRTTNEGIIDGRQILSVEIPTLSELMGSSANWIRYDARKDAYHRIDVPEAVTKTLAARVGHWKFPVLAGFIGMPTLRADGSILQAPGYDARTGLLLELDGESWNIPESPTKQEALVAIEELKELIKDFPFVTPVDRSVALSAFLTACIRRSLPSAPLHAFSARAAGTGKSKLADIASILTCGEPAAVIGMGDTEAELEKRLGAKFLAGDSVISIDNIERPIEGDFICQVLTQQTVSVRILGKSEAPNLPTSALLTATGNQLKVQGDMVRRTVQSNMDARMERPELRVFDIEPVSHVLKNRRHYVRCCLTVLRAFQVAGKPRQANPIGSFEAWSSMVRDALIWIGEADPAVSMDTIRSEDPRRMRDIAFVSSWWALFQDVPMTMRDVIAAAQAKDTNFEAKNPDLYAAIVEIASERGMVNHHRLGAWLRKHDGTIMGKFEFSKLAKSDGYIRWVMKKAD